MSEKVKEIDGNQEPEKPTPQPLPGGEPLLYKQQATSNNMKTLFILLTALIPATMTASKFPEAEISNKIIKAKLYLPDVKEGYYQGTRFDWAGNIPSLKVNGHEYFGQWFEKYSPEIHDAIMGPVEEFTALDYNEAKPGESFIKIGVGVLTKPDDKAYSFARVYPVVDHGKWTIKKKADQVEFTHKLASGEYSYVYTKTVRLVPGKPEMELVHSLKNTGKKTIETPAYNHNFFVIDNQKVGPDYTVKFAWDLKGEGNGFGTLAEVEGNKIIFLRNFAKGETVFCPGFEGFGPSASDYDILIENRKVGASVHITCDRPLLKQVFWSCWTTPCPEPYILVKAAPGEEFTWTIRYEFYNL